jgi:hypothetical protein
MFGLHASGAAARRRPSPTSWSSDPVAAVAELICSSSRLHRSVHLIDSPHFTVHQIPSNPPRRKLARFSTPTSPTPVAALPSPGKDREHGRRHLPRRPWYSPTHSRVSTPSASRAVTVAATKQSYRDHVRTGSHSLRCLLL